MDFFAAQDHSRRQSRRLLWLYSLAVLAVVLAVTAILGAAWYALTAQGGVAPADWLRQNGDALLLIAIGTAGLIGLAAAFRLLSLRDGGERIARELGGSEVPAGTDELLQRRLRNVVEEMAIASGIPVPRVFVLEREEGINAFAAGYRAEEAVVAVTRGALEALDRDQLQGVVAHEFSHILNGDMRLNIQLLGPLFGIMIIGHVGRLVLRSTGRVRVGSRRGRGQPLILLVAAGLVVVGLVGVWSARLIRAAVSRQREYLADASAVQFTRQPAGIAGALKKIAALAAGSRLRAADAEEVSHMLFAPGAGIARLFATHPPLLERIRRLDPAFDPRELEQLETPAPGTGDEAGETTGAWAGLTGELPAAEAAFGLAPSAVPARAGEAGEAELRIARHLHRSLPAPLYEAAHSRRDAPLLLLALALHPDAEPRAGQFTLLAGQLGRERLARIEEYSALLSRLGPQYRLALLDLAFPALRERPEPELDYFLELLGRVVEADGVLQLFEYCLSRIAAAGLRPGRPTTLRRPRPWPQLQAELQTAFAALAAHGHRHSDAAVAALRAGLAALDPSLTPSPDAALALLRLEPGWHRALDAALDRLGTLPAAQARELLAALTVAATEDGRITVAESELLRVFCAVLGCPLPPLYAAAGTQD